MAPTQITVTETATRRFLPPPRTATWESRVCCWPAAPICRPGPMMERRRSVSRRSVAMPKSPNFCAAMGLRNRDSRKVSARGKAAVFTSFVLCFSMWPSGKSFAREKGETMSLQMSSAAFSAGDAIPKKFTCDGPDASPQLKWNDPPANTRELPEGVAKQEQLPNGARQGRNDFGKIGYGGPCPPPGKPHRYFFKVYALDTKLDLKAGATKADVERAMKGHILAQGELIGKYGR